LEHAVNVPNSSSNKKRTQLFLKRNLCELRLSVEGRTSNACCPYTKSVWR